MENLTVVNYADQRVLTTKQLAEIYETEEGTSLVIRDIL